MRATWPESHFSVSRLPFQLFSFRLNCNFELDIDTRKKIVMATRGGGWRVVISHSLPSSFRASSSDLTRKFQRG